MSRRAPARLLVWLFALLPLLAAGCASGGRGLTSGFSPFTRSHRLTDTAKELRWANAGAREVPRELEKQPLPAFTVEPGDVLLVLPSELDSPVRLPGDQPVLPDGTINLGKYGQLLVAGKTVADIQSMVQAAVQTQTKDSGYIQVRLVSRQSKVYYVLGEVNSPGAFQLQGRETVLDALMSAGGLTDNASGDNIILSRPTKPNCPRTILPVCYRAIVQHGDTTTNYQIAPGDRIYVPSRTMLESFFGGQHQKTPCCGTNVPNALPPYPGGPCCDHPLGLPAPSLDLPRPVEGPLVPATPALPRKL